MKATMVTLMAFVAMGATALKAQSLMNINFNDGTTQNIDVSTIKDITWTEIEGNMINGHEYVDLGLPSGLKWATCNVGATAPEEYGDYYAWGEIETKESYLQSTYSYFHEGGAVDSDGFEIDLWDDLGDISGTEYDVARQKWGVSWRMPTQSNFWELYWHCTWTWGAWNTVYGYKVTGINGNWIFLPAAGVRGAFLLSDGLVGYYWSSTPHWSGQSNGYKQYFDDSDIRIGSYASRCSGLSIRPVTE